MGSLRPNSNILDIDAIEDHIGPKGLRIVDFGWYTTDNEENEAIENARNNAAQLRAQAATQMGEEPNLPDGRGEQARILTR